MKELIAIAKNQQACSELIAIASTVVLLHTSTTWSSAVIQTHQTWARFGRELSKDNPTSVCSDWQIQHIELSQTWVVRFPCAVSSKTFKNPDYIDVKRLTSASATAQMGAHLWRCD